MIGISEKDLFELIAEVGRRNPREIVRKINGPIVKWRIAKSKAGEEGAYGLIAGLINESFSDRISRGELQYKDFLDLLTYRTREEKVAKPIKRWIPGKTRVYPTYIRQPILTI